MDYIYADFQQIKKWFNFHFFLIQSLDRFSLGYSFRSFFPNHVYTEKSKPGADRDRILPYLFCFMTLVLFLHTIVFIHISPSGRTPEFTVDDASLTQFSYTKSNYTLSYNLALNISIRNPNKRSSLEYRGIQVIAY